jgi:hypothetical protein
LGQRESTQAELYPHITAQAQAQASPFSPRQTTITAKSVSHPAFTSRRACNWSLVPFPLPHTALSRKAVLASAVSERSHRSSCSPTSLLGDPFAYANSTSSTYCSSAGFVTKLTPTSSHGCELGSHEVRCTNRFLRDTLPTSVGLGAVCRPAFPFASSLLSRI